MDEKFNSLNLDRVDFRLLEALQEDASRSTAELAELASVSQSVCWRRIQRLRDEGLIKRQVALLDRKQLGLHAQVFTQIKLSAVGRANLSDFAEAIRTFPEVLECYVLMGPMDFMLRIVMQSIEEYERFFFEKLSKLAGIQEINSTVALSEIKSTTALPISEIVASKSRISRNKPKRLSIGRYR
jgi:Lrp/AsnC family transcriptional regulator